MQTLDDFGVFILTHGRPDQQATLATVREAGYTGKLWLLIDDEDKTGDAYRARYGSSVLTFSKSAYAHRVDLGDAEPSRATVTFARHAVFDVATQLGLKYLCMLDDDYVNFGVVFDRGYTYHATAGPIRTQFNAFCEAMLAFLDSTGAATVCIAQGGDYIGGFPPGKTLLAGRRKAMNVFFCRVDRPLNILGRLNDDVNTYVEGGRRGVLYFTTMLARISQGKTQARAGGLTETYLELGTYRKSFYSVMFCPSAATIGKMGDPHSPHFRMHHEIDWRYCAAKIVRESVRKPRA